MNDVDITLLIIGLCALCVMALCIWKIYMIVKHDK